MSVVVYKYCVVLYINDCVCPENRARKNKGYTDFETEDKIFYFSFARIENQSNIISHA